MTVIICLVNWYDNRITVLRQKVFKNQVSYDNYTTHNIWTSILCNHFYKIFTFMKYFIILYFRKI